MMGAAALARFLVLDIRRGDEGIMRTALIALHRRHLPLGNSHLFTPCIDEGSRFAGRFLAPRQDPDKPTPRRKLRIRGKVGAPYTHIPRGVPRGRSGTAIRRPKCRRSP